MPESRGRKAKRTAGPKTPKKPPPPSKSRWGWVLKALGAVVSAIGLLALLPAVTVEPSNAPEASNPFSGVFKIANAQFYPIQRVRVQAYLWCVRMGAGTNTTRPSLCIKGNIAGSRPEWNQDIPARGSRQIVAGEVLYGTPNALMYAELSIKVSYQPWFLPISFEREDQFYTRRKDNGDIEWLSK